MPKLPRGANIGLPAMSDSELIKQIEASGQDPGDKASMKACTASLKYSWLMTLVMATGDDPEADAGVDQRMAVEAKLPEPPAASAKCGATITPGVLKVSTMRFKKPLCMNCQGKKSA